MFNTPSLLCQGAREALRSADKPHLDPFLARHPGLPGRFSWELICDGLPLKLSTSEGWHNGVSNTPEGLRVDGEGEAKEGEKAKRCPKRKLEGGGCICLLSVSVFSIFQPALFFTPFSDFFLASCYTQRFFPSILSCDRGFQSGRWMKRQKGR